MSEKEYFRVSVSKYDSNKSFEIVRPASLNNPKNNAVMFITEKYMDYVSAFLVCKECLIFWPENTDVPPEVEKRHAVIKCRNPRQGYCRFFKENSITNYPKAEKYDFINGSFLCKTAIIGHNCTIMPNVYIGGEVKLGNNCYIGAGTKIVGTVTIGDNVIIRENTVIGADGLSTDRDENGKALTMPQFGGVIIEDDVQIGALSVIGRGAIDNTIIMRGSKIDNCTFISHNVLIEEDTFIVGETIMFGSSSTGKQAFISGNATIRNGCHIGEKAIVGMGAVVVKDVEDGLVVKGNPAR